MRSVEDILKDTNSQITESIFDEAYGQVIEPTMHEICRKFIFPEKTGKRLRPAIVFCAAKACGIEPEDVQYPALSIEVDHNRYLIHDDIEDQSLKRRGEDCLYLKHGVDRAVNFGDRLEAVAQRAIELEYELGVIKEKDFRRLSQARREQVQATAEGQNYEFCIRRRLISEATEKDVYTILENKTAPYTVLAPCQYAMITAGVKNPEIEAIRDAALKCGVAFQLRDDYLDLAGGLTKDWAGDLEEGKRTLILVRTYKAANSEERAFIDERVGKGTLEDEVKMQIIDIVKKYGVLQGAADEAARLAEEGIKVFRENLPENEGAEELFSLFKYAATRNK